MSAMIPMNNLKKMHLNFNKRQIKRYGLSNHSQQLSDLV